MPITKAARQQLAAEMDKRRLELRLTWHEVAERGGISLRALSSARIGPGNIRPLTRRRIDQGLRWLEGAGVDNLLTGRDPVPLDSPELAPFLAAVEQQVKDAEDAEGKVARAAGRDPRPLPGEKIFRDPRDIALWTGTEGLNRAKRVKFIAEMRQVRAGDAASAGRRIGLTSART